GTGKTSSARILAKALNCRELSADGEPCGRCDACVAIGNGTFMDVIELDAASNNSVSDVRDLLEGVHRVPSGAAKRKVYIIDEVHMLSTAASNALLKTLEEPPEHAVFVLATTDPQKVLPTIRSRTQHFPFTLVPTGLLTDHLETVASDAGITADRAALERIAQQGAGSVRDALSALDQARAFAPDGLDESTVAALYSKASFDERAALLDAAIDRDGALTLEVLTQQLDAGADARALIDDLLSHLRDAVLVAGTRGELPLGSLPDEKRRLNDQARRIGADRLLDSISLLGDAVVEMRRAPDPRLVLEVALLRLAHPNPNKLFEASGASDSQPAPPGPAGRGPGSRATQPASADQRAGRSGPSDRSDAAPNGVADPQSAALMASMERRIQSLEAAVQSLTEQLKRNGPASAATGPQAGQRSGPSQQRAANQTTRASEPAPGGPVATQRPAGTPASSPSQGARPGSERAEQRPGSGGDPQATPERRTDQVQADSDATTRTNRPSGQQGDTASRPSPTPGGATPPRSTRDHDEQRPRRPAQQGVSGSARPQSSSRAPGVSQQGAQRGGALVDRSGQVLRTRPASVSARIVPGDQLTLDNAVMAWPNALARLDARLQRRAAEAQPVDLDGNQVILGLRMMESNIHHDSIRHHQREIEAALSTEIGQPVTLKVVTHGGYTGDSPMGARVLRAKPEKPKDEQLASIERIKAAFDAEVETEVHKSRAERRT
ncbi:MAG: DNA polymerase III subunit gamma/tau, partial [Actinobacteria bacterium]|nr:DNA polymerase III subunit gamma/tau [Actinomycetota bacterium]